MIDPEFLRLHVAQKFNGDRPTSLDLGRRQLGFLEQVEDRQRLLIQPFANGTRCSSSGPEASFKNARKDLDVLILFAVVCGDDVLVVLEVGAERFAARAARDAVDRLAEALRGGPLGGRRTPAPQTL